VLIDSPAPQNALPGKIAYKTGTSYGFRDAWAVGFDGANTIAVWVGRPDNEPVSDLIGRTAAAPILFDAFTRTAEKRTSLPPPPKGVVIARTSELPPALKAMGGAPPFTWFADGLPIVIGELRRETSWEKPDKGFARLSVIDGRGHTASVQVRLD
jgi:penicillin-binding protein 1C